MKRVGIDTNVLLRLIVNDDTQQQDAVLKFGRKLGNDLHGYVPVICLIEMDWALRSQYGYKRDARIAAIRAILRLRFVDIESEDAVVNALSAVEEGADFADAVIAHQCLDAGCDAVVTFDKKAAQKIPIMEMLS